MDPDPLQWLWDGVYDFQTKFNDLRTRAMRNFHRPADVARHDDDCGLKNSQTRMPCSCCKGALTFDEARFVKEKLTDGRAVPNTKKRIFEWVPASACWGIENCKELFGLGNDKEAISAAFDAGIDDHKTNLLFGSNGIVSRTLDHWRGLLDDAYKLNESLRAELFKSVCYSKETRAKIKFAFVLIFRVEYSGSARGAHTARRRLARRCCFRFKPDPLAIHKPPAFRTSAWH